MKVPRGQDQQHSEQYQGHWQLVDCKSQGYKLDQLPGCQAALGKDAYDFTYEMCLASTLLVLLLSIERDVRLEKMSVGRHCPVCLLLPLTIGPMWRKDVCPLPTATPAGKRNVKLWIASKGFEGGEPWKDLNLIWSFPCKASPAQVPAHSLLPDRSPWPRCSGKSVVGGDCWRRSVSLPLLQALPALSSAPSVAVLWVSVTGLMEYVKGVRAAFGGELLTCQAWGSGMLQLSFSHRMSLWLRAVVFCLCLYRHTHLEYVFFLYNWSDSDGWW